MTPVLNYVYFLMFQKAQKYFLEANSVEHIIRMYKDAGHWQKAYEYLCEIGAKQEANQFLQQQADICISEKRYTDAEKLVFYFKSVTECLHQEF